MLVRQLKKQHSYSGNRICGVFLFLAVQQNQKRVCENNLNNILQLAFFCLHLTNQIVKNKEKTKITNLKKSHEKEISHVMFFELNNIRQIFEESSPNNSL